MSGKKSRFSLSLLTPLSLEEREREMGQRQVPTSTFSCFFPDVHKTTYVLDLEVILESGESLHNEASRGEAMFECHNIEGRRYSVRCLFFLPSPFPKRWKTDLVCTSWVSLLSSLVSFPPLRLLFLSPLPHHRQGGEEREAGRGSNSVFSKTFRAGIHGKEV